jgi:aminoglycoside phosphotransferase
MEGFGSLIVADRHLDLAIAHLSVGAVLGQEAVFGFYDAYGRDPDLIRLDRAVLVAHVLGAVPALETTETAETAER